MWFLRSCTPTAHAHNIIRAYIAPCIQSMFAKMDASKAFNSPGGDEEGARNLVMDQSSTSPESTSATFSEHSSPEVERACTTVQLDHNDAHRLQQPQLQEDDQSSNDDSSSDGRRSSPLSRYNPDSEGSGTDHGDDGCVEINIKRTKMP